MRATHRHTAGPKGPANRKTPEYSAWCALKQRCLNPRNPRYRHYGGRGIEVCQRWRDSFVAFLLDVGRRPSAAHSIDRIDNDGHYAPGNVRWATSSEQNLNRPNRKLSMEAIRAIKASTDSARLVGEAFGVSKATVKDIRHGRLHADVV